MPPDTIFLTSPLLSPFPHGFFGRRGGVSTGVFESLNCGLSNADAPKAVTENRARAMRALRQAETSLLTLYQVHSADVVTVTEPFAPEDRPRADALVTRMRGITLGVVTADCVPVLLADPVAGVIGAVHSGWKGTAGNICLNTLAAMEALGARRTDIVAVVGPCIARDSYEVGPEFLGRFPGAFFLPSTMAGRFLFDLRGCVAAALADAGLGSVDVLAHDTCTEEDRFFSNRRAFHRGENGFGLQLSALALD